MAENRIWILLAKKFNGEISLSEENELGLLCQKNKSKSTHLQLINYLNQLKIETKTEDEAKQKSITYILSQLKNEEPIEPNILPENELQQYISAPLWKQKIYRRIIAASVAAAVIIAFIWFAMFFNKTENSGLKLVQTDPHSKETIYLPDGSTVLVNSGSSIHYNKNFGVSKREINLDGEAFFKIKKNPSIPLVVHTASADIWVTGTSFNVKAYHNDSVTEASLITGAIELYPLKNPEQKIIMHPNEKVVLYNFENKQQAKPQNTIAQNDFEKNIIIKPLQRSPEDGGIIELAWIKTKMVFKSESFEHLARNLEIRYGVTINFLDDNAKKLVFTGSFTTETVNEAMEALKSSLHFEYKIEGNKIFIKS